MNANLLSPVTSTKLRLLKSVAILCVLAVAAGGAVLAYRERVLNTHNIVERKSWPRELIDLIDESATRGEPIKIIDVRSVDFMTTYAWRMPATDNQLGLHLDRFNLIAVSPNGIEHERIASRWPRAWDLPTTDINLYANPAGLPGADDGEFEFVLIHDKGMRTIHFYYYFNF